MPRLQRRTTHRLLLTLLAVVLGATTLSCSKLTDDDDLPDLPALDKAWGGPELELAIGGEWDAPALWQDEEVLVALAVEGRGTGLSAHGLDADNGEELWSIEVNGRWCASSQSVNSAGIGAVLVAPGGNDCTQVVAIDTRAGETAWTQTLPPSKQNYPAYSHIAIGDRTVNTPGTCGDVLRYDAATGTAQPAVVNQLPTDDGPFGCGAITSLSDDLLVHQTKDGAVAEDGAGTVLWRTSEPMLLHGVISSDPVILDVTIDGQRAMHRYDDTGRDLGAFGLGMGISSQGFNVVAQTAEVIVGKYEAQYAQADQVYAYDLTSGEQLWKRGNDRYGSLPRLVGAHQDSLIWSQDVDTREGETDYPMDQVWITATDPRDPTKGRTLGRVVTDYSASDLWFQSGDLLINPGSSGLSAWDLNAKGEDGVQVAPRSRTRDAEVKWREGDVRPLEAADACRALTPSTLSMAGLPESLLPPENCEWAERRATEQRVIRVAVAAGEPGEYEDGPRTATEQAEQVMKAQLQTETRAREVDGLGDEASFISADYTKLAEGGELDFPYGSAVETATKLVVRQRNVVVTIDVLSNAGTRSAGRALTPDEAERAALSAATDVFDELGLSIKAPAPGADGPVLTAPDACKVALPEARRFASDPRPEDISREGSSRFRGCVYSERYDSSLHVITYAVPPGPIDGQSAVDRADALLTSIGGEAVGGLGDRAAQLTNLGSSYDETTLLAARRGNLLVLVHSSQDTYDRPNPPSPRVMQKIAARALAP